MIARHDFSKGTRFVFSMWPVAMIQLSICVCVGSTHIKNAANLLLDALDLTKPTCIA